MILKLVKQRYFEHTSVYDELFKLCIRKSKELCISIKLKHDSIPDVITDVEGGDDGVQMGDVVGVSGNVLEADVGDLDCFLYVV